ncbi:hypothetical protein [Pseudoalteromonas holothuriae]|uniref:hypothetical protein n=1 Tax=Pseudoalteromonas holothuriae TaxID=2963714 RepID=UPI0021C12A3C|nr:hypothetical protein [Pseudoalteromonas sp. CIP111951]
MWLYCSGTDLPVGEENIPNIVLFDYQNSRAGRCPVGFLQEDYRWIRRLRANPSYPRWLLGTCKTQIQRSRGCTS